ncbi:alpha/beta hydrolase [Mycolicibacterium helvum]|uniref:Alpha/beta hydrolase n=1 Tax=Mycolicibacterium helvum TaxID=1534349 RepID=A0A7I7SZ84_9MYCO|nr:alpha/beta hydrolase [Mycolicibacterium helvum]BBY62108.1 alpha/beta hydrolase [Mycolicibacterium helvum]
MARFGSATLRLSTLIGVTTVIGLPLAACTAPETPAAQSSSLTVVSAPAAPPPGAVKPTIVLVHGAWAETSSWDGEVAELQKQGYDTRAISNPLQNLTTDAESVKSFLATLAGPIVLVGHSYGGSVITNAAEGNPNVKALVYVDAAAPEVGETTKSLSGNDSVLSTHTDAQLFDSVPYPGGPAGASDLYLKKDIFVGNFGNDLPTDTATQLWATQRAASTVAFGTRSQFAAWKTIPSWYFISSGDQIITPTAEKAMAARAHSQVTVFDGGSHLTLISHPDAVTAVVDQAIASVR